MKKKHKDDLKKRKDKIKNNKKYRKFIDRHPQFPGIITSVYCKGCGKKIKAMNENNLLIPTYLYSEITMVFDNGSRHVTASCTKCEKSASKEDLEAMYVADLEEFEREDTGQRDTLWDLYLNRIPEKIEKPLLGKKLKAEKNKT